MRRALRVLALAAVAFAAPLAGAQGAAAFRDASARTQQVAEAYFSAYVARDWDRLAPLLHERGGFRDPTAALVFGGVGREGKAATLRFFREAYAVLTHMAFHRTRAFFAGEVAVFEGTLDWTVLLGDGREAVTERMPFVTVLRLEDGLVVEHRDYADYHAYLAAARRPAGKGG